MDGEFCRWWPGLEPVQYGFRYSLVIIQRAPRPVIISHHQMYASQEEIGKAIALLGKEPYDVIWACRSFVQVECLAETSEDQVRFVALCNKLLVSCNRRQLRGATRLYRSQVIGTCANAPAPH